jgi:iron(III) transport system substrate-binding protein
MAAALAAACVGSSCASPTPTLVVYASDDGLAEWIEASYGASHPGEVLRVETLTSDDALKRLEAEAAAPVADVWLGAPSWMLARAAERGFLGATAPAWAVGLSEDMKDPDGQWTGWTADPMVLAFNTDRTARGRAPRDWIDLFHPRWTGDVLLQDPRGSDAMVAFIGFQVARAAGEVGDETPGFDWLARLDATRKAYVTDPNELMRRLGSGDVAVAPVPLSLAQRTGDAGRPVDYRVPETGSPSLLRGVAMVGGAPHAEAAIVLVAWLGTPEAQLEVARRFAYVPVAPDVPVEGVAWLANVQSLLRLEFPPAGTLATHLDGWLSRWREEVMGRTNRVF